MPQIVKTMTPLAPIKLDEDWTYLFSENRRPDYSTGDTGEAMWIPLPSLSDWSVASSPQAGADWFQRMVNLEPQDVCVNYVLQIDNVPDAVTVYVNGVEVGQATGHRAFDCDVTAHVSLGENLITLRLIASAQTNGGGFGKVSLVPIPCGE